MKLLRVTAKNFKNCKDDYTIDLTSKANKTEADKLYELQEIAPNLFTYNTMAFVGKNASGKTTAIDLLDCCYSILEEFQLDGNRYSYDNVELEIYFHHNESIYKYTTILKNSEINSRKAEFTEEHIYKKAYYPSKVNKIFSDVDFEEINDFTELPEGTSKIFFILKKKQVYNIYYDSQDENVLAYPILFGYIESYKISISLFYSILSIFDENIKELTLTEDKNYKINYNGRIMIKSASELMWFLSSGTTKGMCLYTLIAISLIEGIDLLVDEVENHFHKTLVENIISLYKDPAINKHNATLIFTTHYCEVLDLFGRKDNIWISKSDKQVYLQNMYDVYKENNIRSELLKSRQFYNNTFDTAVNYEALMNLKRELMK
ncbi:MAG: ATP-binding protein [Ruminococcus sp.]|nr:ATP-binding protein [Ruminococcus sp.]